MPDKTTRRQKQRHERAIVHDFALNPLGYRDTAPPSLRVIMQVILKMTL
jgi:hypothetical protein